MAETRLHCDVLVAGAGPAGIAAAVAARRAGKHVVVVDDNPHAGGQIWRGMNAGHAASVTARKWLRRFTASGAELLASTRIVAAPRANVVLAEHEGNAIHIHYDALVLATGARELLLPFPGWTLPGVMGAGGLQAMAKAGLPLRGKRVVVAGTGPLLLAVAAAFVHKGAIVPGVFDQASRESTFAFAASLLTRPSLLLQGLQYLARIRPWRYRQGWWPLCAHGEADVLHSIAMTDGHDTLEIPCDYFACGFHLVPNTELGALLGCRIHNGAIIADDHQRTSVANVFTAGEAAGIAGLPQALVEGEIAGAHAGGAGAQVRHLLRRRTALRRVAARMNHAYTLRPELRALPQNDTVICRCEDVSWQQLQGFSSMRSAKIHTRCGMGPCQGRICGAAMQFLAGWHADTHRPPLYPVQLSTLLPLAAHDTTHQEKTYEVARRDAGNDDGLY